MSTGVGLRARRAPVTSVLIATCVAVFAVGLGTTAVEDFGLFAPVLAAYEPYRFLTSGFVHASVLHLAMNMFCLWILGSALEPALGKTRFAAIYLLALLGGNVTVLALANPQDLSWYTAVVGASGAIFGLFGAQLAISARAGLDNRPLIALILFNLIWGFLPGSGISWQSHVGGFIVGAAVTWLMVRRRTPGRRTLLAARDSAVVIGAAAALGAIAWLSLGGA